MQMKVFSKELQNFIGLDEFKTEFEGEEAK